MQRSIEHLPRVSEMQAFRLFLFPKHLVKLNGTNLISNHRLFCSHSFQKWLSLHHFSSSQRFTYSTVSNQDEEEEASSSGSWLRSVPDVVNYMPDKFSVEVLNQNDGESSIRSEVPRVLISGSFSTADNSVPDSVSNEFQSKVGEESSIGDEFSGGDEISRVSSGSISRLNRSVPMRTSEETRNRGEESNNGDERPTRVSASSVSRVKKTIFKRSTDGVKKPSEESGSGDEITGVSSGSESRVYGPRARKTSGKSKIAWVCQDCGESDGQWWGICPSCKAVGTLKQFNESENTSNKSRGVEVSENAVRSWFQRHTTASQPRSLAEVNMGINPLEWRIPLPGLFGMEVARVLGGGVVPGSLVLVGGDPGVGKSTLILQIAAMLAEGCGSGGPFPVIYVSGEESVEQIGNRADRMKIETSHLFLYSSTDIEDIFEKIQPLSPRALIVDSIQTVYLNGVTGSAGSVTQVKECTSALLRFAKQTMVVVFLIGHVTKTGDIAGPRVLEHIVDAVLYMEGERYMSHRILRSVKNRFGSTDELGLFEMSQTGLQAVSNPSLFFLNEHSPFDSEVLAGLAVAAIFDGSRTFLIEIQALCASGSPVARHVNGLPESKADLIISVLMKQAGLKLQRNAIFLNVVSGFKLTETAGDLAIAAAICSSFLELPIPNDVAFIGEVGLGGELRTVPRMDKRVMELSKLGFKKCVIPESSKKSLATISLEGLNLICCKNLKEMIDTIFAGGTRKREEVGEVMLGSTSLDDYIDDYSGGG